VISISKNSRENVSGQRVHTIPYSQPPASILVKLSQMYTCAVFGARHIYLVQNADKIVNLVVQKF